MLVLLKKCYIKFYKGLKEGRIIFSCVWYSMLEVLGKVLEIIVLIENLKDSYDSDLYRMTMF